MNEFKYIFKLFHKRKQIRRKINQLTEKLRKFQAELKFLNNHFYSSYSEDEIECWNKFFKKYCFVSNDSDSIYFFKEVKLVNDVLYADCDFFIINEKKGTKMSSPTISIKECLQILDCGFTIKKIIPYYSNLLKKE